ncbi:MAG: T9SS type A sorting domain-containing protein [Candidatus Marinimicrobia bacterium]|nr:T9SS type A sorting domain-containing protein [Candidatus Neomarinimicrobiota bacterium]MCF7829411.1 T9SS type A sorting domain-containing protein [Candidatus Neomarinimicrobiota bacterium]MCF7880897.1 T9SS type A sorting domain-containing protein [Candidatus Neomarinimicrobiota bacterium]
MQYSIPKPSDVNITIYNLRDQQVATIVNQHQERGWYTVQWDGTNDFGKSVSTGVYFYRLETLSYNAIRKMVHLK